MGDKEKGRFGGKNTLGFLLLAKPVVGEALGAAEQFWNCASHSPKVFKTLLLPAFPLGGQNREKLLPPAVVFCKKLKLLGGVVWKHCRFQITLRDLRLKASRTEKCFRGAGMGRERDTTWARHKAELSHQPSPLIFSVIL